MPTTSNGFRYPASTDPPNGPQAVSNLANDLNAFFNAWTDYTPTLGWTNVTITTAKYLKLGKLVTVNFLLTLSGTPAGTFSMSTPTTSAATANRQACGQAMMIDGGSDATRRSATVFLLSTTTVSLLDTTATTSALVSTTNPWTWASTDTIGGTFTYREA